MQVNEILTTYQCSGRSSHQPQAIRQPLVNLLVTNSPGIESQSCVRPTLCSVADGSNAGVDSPGKWCVPASVPWGTAKPPSHPSTRVCGLATPSVIPTCVAKPSLAGVPVRANKGTVKRYNAQLELITDCDVPLRLNVRYLSRNSKSGLVRSFSVCPTHGRTARRPSDAERMNE